MELLIVMVILGLVIAILMPAISKGRANAKKANCASNLRSLAQGVQMYAADWDQYLVPEFHRGIESYTASYSYNARESLANQPNALPWGFALLNVTGNIKDTRMFYCPSQSASGWDLASLTYRQWTNPDGSLRPGAVPVRIGYMYQVHSTCNAAVGGTQTVLALTDPLAARPFPAGNFVCAAYGRYPIFPRNLVLGCDILYDINTIPHDNGQSVNAVFIDGHVSNPNDTYFKNLNPSVGYLNNNWSRLDRELAHIENGSN
jgi:prepilin-type processing-associated H-X9-DG protein